MDTVLVNVSIEELGSRLMADAAVGDTVLSVEWPADFGQSGDLVLGGNTYSYDDVDVYGNTVALEAGVSLTVAALEDDPVKVVTATAEDSTIWRAYVETADSDQPLPAIIPMQLRRFFTEGEAQAGSVVTVYENERGQLEVSDAATDKSIEVSMSLPAGSFTRVDGVMKLGAGISAPTKPARVGLAWDHPDAYTDTDIDVLVGTVRGLHDNGTDWVITQSFFDGGVWSVDKTTGLRTLLANQTTTTHLVGHQPFGGVVKVGTDWYLLVYRNSDATWWVQKYNASWVWQSQWQRATAGSIPNGQIALGTDGTRLFTTYRNSGGVLVVDRYNLDGTGATVIFTSTVATGSAVTGLYIGSADFGATRYVVACGNGFYVFNSSGARQVAQEWQRGNSESVWGLAWDGTSFHSFAATGTLWHYGRTVTATPRSVRYSLYDNDAGGTGTHETEAGDPVVYLQKPRTWFRVEVDPPDDTGAPDDPNAVRIYIDDQRQTDPGTGVISAVYDVPSTGGSPPPTSNGFTGVGAPGEFLGGGSDVDGDRVRVTGEEVERFAPLTDSYEPWGASADLTSSGVAPNIGSTGTWAAGVEQFGKKVRFYIEVVFSGAGISGGSGTWRLPLPVAPKTGVRWKFEGNAYDGTSDWDISGRWASSVSKLILGCRPTTAGNADRGVSATAPFAPADGCRYFMHGEYETD